MGATLLNLNRVFKWDYFWGALNVLFSSVNALENMHLFQRKGSFVGLVDRNRTVLLNHAALTSLKFNRKWKEICFLVTHSGNKHVVQHVKCLDSPQSVWSLHNCPYPKRDIWPSSPSSLSWFSLRNV